MATFGLDFVSPALVASRPPVGPWPEPAPPTAPYFAETEAEPLASLADEPLSPRFCAWRGASGRRYIASVYEARACPAYCDAALIAVAAERDGRRRIIGLRTPAPIAGRLELHLHLLAATTAERRAALDDLAAAAPYAARS